MTDSSDFSTGECSFCGRDWEICLITTNLSDIEITECENGHPVCVKHFCQEIQDLFDEEDNEEENEYMTGKVGWEVCNTVRSKFCPVCKKLKKEAKTPLTVESLIKTLQKIKDKESIVVIESSSKQGRHYIPATDIKVGKYDSSTEWEGKFGETGKSAITIIGPDIKK